VERWNCLEGSLAPLAGVAPNQGITLFPPIMQGDRSSWCQLASCKQEVGCDLVVHKTPWRTTLPCWHPLSSLFGGLCVQPGVLSLQRLDLRLDLPLEGAAPLGQTCLLEYLQPALPIEQVAGNGT